MLFPNSAARALTSNMMYKLPLKLGYLAIFCLLLLLSAKETGCRNKQSTASALPATSARSSKQLIEKNRQSLPDNLRSLSGKANIYIEGQGQSISATAQVIWLRDSMVWMNVKKFGIEAARALATRDSVFVLNRLNKTFTAEGIESLRKNYKLPAGFELIQYILLAQPWYFEGMNLSARIDRELHVLEGNDGAYLARYSIEEGTFNLREEMFVQQKEGGMVTLQFNDFRKTGGAKLPYSRKIEAFDPENGATKININFSELTLNGETNFRFEIPDHYQRSK